jgi:hypothetical protein
MAISDIYLVQYLLQGTQAVPKRIVWREKDTEGYEAEVSGVLLELGLAASTAGSHLYLTLSLKRDKVCIEEPRSTSLFRQRYESEDHRQLAALMSNLQAAIVLQCCSRGPVAVEERCRIRETIFRRVLFEDREAARPNA